MTLMSDLRSYCNLAFSSLLNRVNSKARPSLLIFEPTLSCNSQCITCFNLDRLNQPDKFIDLTRTEEIAEALPQLSMLFIAGGEPVLNKTLPEQVAIFQEHTQVNVVCIPTNGSLPEQTLEVVEKCCDLFRGHVVLSLSIDGLGTQHDHIRGLKGNFEKLQITYGMLVKAMEKYKNLHLSANTCICAQNKDNYREVLDWVSSNWKAVSGHSISLVRNPVRPEVNFDVLEFLTTEREWLAARAAKRAHYKLPVVGRLNRRFWKLYYELSLEYHQGAQRSWRCSSGDGGALYIDAENGVHPCELLPAAGYLSKDNSLKEIIESESYLNACQQIKDRACNCDHGCFVQHSLFTTPDNLGLWLTR